MNPLKLHHNNRKSPSRTKGRATNQCVYGHGPASASFGRSKGSLWCQSKERTLVSLKNEEIRLVNKLGGAVFLQYAANKNKHKLNPKTQHNKAGKCLVNVL